MIEGAEESAGLRESLLVDVQQTVELTVRSSLSFGISGETSSGKVERVDEEKRGGTCCSS